jgi:diaminopimelate epimerase
VIPAEVRYAKGHGTENDFVILFDPERALDLTPPLVQALCDRRRGLGADGVLRAALAAADPEGAQMSDGARWFMDYRNADGSVAEMCGNGIRVFARYLVATYRELAGEFAIATRGGLRRVRLGPLGDVSVEMGEYDLPALGPVHVVVDGISWPALPVYVPNPHAVVFLDDLELAGELAVPPEITPASVFPAGANVEFVVSRGPHHLAMRVFERGVGETRSCGTGACAVAVAATESTGAPTEADNGGPASGPRSGGLDGDWIVDTPGGRLVVTVGDRRVTLTGPAVLVAEGAVSGDWISTYQSGGRRSRQTAAPH